MLSRSGTELKRIWEHQASLIESEANLRRLERARRQAPQDQGIRQQHHAALVRAGRAGDVMRELVHDHGLAHRKFTSDVKNLKPDTAADPSHLIKTKDQVNKLRRKHKIHPANHIKRHQDESPKEFADRLAHHAQGHSWRPGLGEHSHGTISYHKHHDREEDHYAKRDAMARAWKREVPNGHVEVGDRTRADKHDKMEIVGSYIHFKTKPASS